MSVSSLDLETSPVGTPLRLIRTAAVAPARVRPPVAAAAEHRVVDLTDHAASYWVRRRRELQAAKR